MVDYVMFRRFTPQGIVLLILYVDDMVIIGSYPATIVTLKRHLQSEFEIKDLGFFCYFLGIDVAYSSRGYLLSQRQYIANILDHATLSDSNVVATSSSVSTPMKLHLKLRRANGTPLPQPTRYTELVILSSFYYSPGYFLGCSCTQTVCNAPTSAHYAVLLHVLCYF